MILLDTNILVCAAASKSPWHAKARELRDQAASGQIDACVAAQVLGEFYAVVTDPRRFQPALTANQARGELQNYLSSRLRVILSKETTVARMLHMLGSRSVRGGKIFDLFLAATMLDNGVRTIYTENESDFKSLPGIEVINPLSPG